MTGIPDIRIGTSGWNYKHWRGIFYPEKLAQRKWLEFYCEHFDTVEVNSTFYRLPPSSTFEGWKKRTPDGFLWAVKVPRKITHIHKLKDVGDLVLEFLGNARFLSEKLGPVLFQLPPGLKLDIALMQDFLVHLRNVKLPVIEVRNKSWLVDNFFQLLKEFGVALCISHSGGRFPYVPEITSSFTYIRFHGPGKLYSSDYSDDELNRWAHQIIEWNVSAFVYFNNDFDGFAVKNALTLRKFIEAYISGE